MWTSHMSSAIAAHWTGVAGWIWVLSKAWPGPLPRSLPDGTCLAQQNPAKHFLAHWGPQIRVHPEHPMDGSSGLWPHSGGLACWESHPSVWGLLMRWECCAGGCRVPATHRRRFMLFPSSPSKSSAPPPTPSTIHPHCSQERLGPGQTLATWTDRYILFS